ncbi:hypothetical protein [Leptospira santarosai]|uniref:hypothetical protein n=1 Tax=Leptospira santarosai TaxID=28183 RepID=UPI0012902A4B|nr:hypothetical protein [Leptospira santarosai]
MTGANDYKFQSRIILSDGTTVVGKSLNEFLQQLEIENAELFDLVTFTLDSERTSVELRFVLNEGCEILATHLDEEKLQKEVHYIHRRLQKFNNETNGIVELIIRNRFLETIFGFIFFFSSIWFLFAFPAYIYASNSAVNIAKEIIPKGNAYFSEVEKAILSQSIELKLNVLLKGQLRGFINRDDAIESYKFNSLSSFGGIFLSIIFYCLRKYYRYLYPKSFFAFGTNVKFWNRRIISRNIFNVVIITGFLVSFASGLLTIFLFQ